jgi:lipoic acid synthetase
MSETVTAEAETSLKRKPSWLRAKLPTSPEYRETRELVDTNKLHTVCQSAQCPNMGECWSRGTATVMILGNICTRACSFCAIQTGRPTEFDIAEPARVADAVAKMKLKHCVVTSVSRDDLKDGGASVWASTIRAIHYRCPDTAVEVLIPDFRGRAEHLDVVLEAKPEILNHNMETVKRLQRPVRKTAKWDRSLWVLDYSKQQGFVSKSGLMLGIGEKKEEVHELVKALADVKLDILTIGQYLSPSSKHAPVDRWVTPEEFDYWRDVALEAGIGHVESGPLVRSSYKADEQSAKYGLRNLGKSEAAPAV